MGSAKLTVKTTKFQRNQSPLEAEKQILCVALTATGHFLIAICERVGGKKTAHCFSLSTLGSQKYQAKAILEKKKKESSTRRNKHLVAGQLARPWACVRWAVAQQF